MSRTKEFHNMPFDEGTKCKLELYQNYLRGWLPVFINTLSIERIQIFDFFAGPGTDVNGTYGSPLLAAKEIRDAIDRSKGKIDRTILFDLFLNELEPKRFSLLQQTALNIRQMLPEVTVHETNQAFATLFPQYLPKMNAAKTANFIFMDQFGLKEITEDIFKDLIALPKTDFMFFLAASTANRFKDIEDVAKYLPPLTQDERNHMNGDNALQILSKAYRHSWIPESIRDSYFLGDFSIKKGANVYGLIFGSKHPYGLQKFLEAAWKLGGYANFDAGNDGYSQTQPSLFEEYSLPLRITDFQHKLEKHLRTKPQKNNHWLYRVGLINGVLPKYVKDVVKRLQREGFIKNSLNISYNAFKNPAVKIEYADDEVEK